MSKLHRFFLILALVLTVAVPAMIVVQRMFEVSATGTDHYAVVGQGHLTPGTGTTDSTLRLVPGANVINCTGLGTFTVTMCSGTSATGTDGANCLVDVEAYPTATATGIVTSGAIGTFTITVTYGTTGLWSSKFAWSTTSGGTPGNVSAVPGKKIVSEKVQRGYLRSAKPKNPMNRFLAKTFSWGLKFIGMDVKKEY